MIKKVKYIYILFLLLPFSIASCYEAPELPEKPKIAFKNIIFKELPDGKDSLILSINFEDGNGNLGLRPDEDDGKYARFIIPTDEMGNYIPYRCDTCPPYNCNTYEYFETLGEDTIKDTIYAKTNPNHNNIFVDYYIKRNGVFEKYQFPGCINFDGRFPALNSDEQDRPLEGSLSYGMSSSAFRILFLNDTLQLRVQIQDREFNRSNVVETPPFTLEDITQN